MNPYIQYMYSYPHKTAYRTLRGIRLEDYRAELSGGRKGLYFHIPFCQAKCGYCNLFSVTGQSEAAADRYLDAAERQAGQYRDVLAGCNTEFSEMVIGGGTPLYLTERQLQRVFSIASDSFSFSQNREVTVETAPNQTTAEKLAVLKGEKATRISLGIQSFSDRELSTLKRQHDSRKAKEALKLIKSFDFPCVNVDFIYGIPGQTAESLLKSLSQALEYEPDEIFLYPLYVKHGVGLEREGVVPDPEKALDQYRQGSIFLKEKGFRQDSMRRFVREKGERVFSECGFGASLALGCGGRSYLGNLHFCTPYAITGKECHARLEEYERREDYAVIDHGILLGEEEMKRRYVIRHLFIRPGLKLCRYREHFGSDARQDFPILSQWQEEGYVQRQGENLTLTDAGLELSDYLGPMLMSRQVREAMEQWDREQGCPGRCL